MKDLLKWLWRKDVLNEEYSFLSRNCQDSAKIVFNHVAVSKGISHSEVVWIFASIIQAISISLHGLTFSLNEGI